MCPRWARHTTLVRRQRGLASGLAVSGIGVGTAVLLIAAALLGVGDWRMAFRVLAAGALICGGIMPGGWTTSRQGEVCGPTTRSTGKRGGCRRSADRPYGR